MMPKDIIARSEDLLSRLENAVPLYAGTDKELELEALFLQEYFIKTILYAAMAIDDESLPLTHFKTMQDICRGVFPYWIDNDIIFGLGKKKLKLLSCINKDFFSQDEFDSFLKTVKSEYCPAVSVIMPTFNRPDSIAKAAKSVLDQTYPLLELIVVNDGGSEDTRDIIAGLNDERVRYIHLSENKGPSAARNHGIRNAAYDLVAFHDDDDLWKAEKLEKQVDALYNSALHAGFAYCEMAYHRIGEDNEVLRIPATTISKVRKEGYIYPELLRRNFIGGPTILVYKSCFNKIGYFNEKLPFFEDWELILRLAKEYEACFIPEPLYDYYERALSRSMVKDVPQTAIKDFYEDFAPDKERFGL